MMRSLYSGVSGLRAHQTRMDVIGSNIANVNTYGFKSSRVTFRDVIYQTMSTAASASAEDPVRGGTNPYQIGLGVSVATVDVLNTRSGPATTDFPYDLYIDGEGYFKVTSSSGLEYYTRVGDFRFDEVGHLTDGYGSIVMGAITDDETALIADGDEAVNIWIENYQDYTQISIDDKGVIHGYYSGTDGTQGIVKLGQIAVYTFNNPSGLSQEGNSYYLPSNNTGEPLIHTPGLEGTGKVISGRLEMSNVDLSKEFTDMIITQRGFQANSRIITVSDEMLQELVNLKR